MSDLNIRIKTTKDGRGAEETAKAIRDVKEASKETTQAVGEHEKAQKSLTEQVEKAARSKHGLVAALKHLGHEYPLLGAILHQLRNPFTIVAIVMGLVIAKTRELITDLREMSSAVNLSRGNMETSIATWSNAAEAIDKVTKAQAALKEQLEATNGFLQNQIDLIEESIKAQAEQLEAQKQVELLKIEATEKDPIARQVKLNETAQKFDARIFALNASKPGQQAAIIEKQIAQEKVLQQEAVSSVPKREQILGMVRATEEDRKAVEEASGINRQKFLRAELFRGAQRISGSPNVMSEALHSFSDEQIRQLRQEKLLVDDIKTGRPKIDTELLAKIMPGAEAEATFARERFERAQRRLRMDRGQLPAGVATEADVEAYVSTAESEAAKTAGESYKRQGQLELKRDSLLRQQKQTIAVGQTTAQTNQLRGELSLQSVIEEQNRKTEQESQQLAREILTMSTNAITGQAVTRALQAANDVLIRQQGQIEKLEKSIRNIANQ